MSELKWSQRSEKELATVEYDLKRVLDHALYTGIIDMAVIQGRRPKDEQDKYFNKGKSKVKWPDSKHNVLNPEDLATAVDVAPYIEGKGVVWNVHNCLVMVGVILSSAYQLGVKVRSGSNWDQDREYVTDQSFQDLVHFELVD